MLNKLVLKIKWGLIKFLNLDKLESILIGQGKSLFEELCEIRLKLNQLEKKYERLKFDLESGQYPD